MKTLKFLGKRTHGTRTFWEWEKGFSIEFGGQWWINFPHDIEPFSSCISQHHAYASLRGVAKGQGFALESCQEIEQKVIKKNRNYLAAQHRYASSIGVDAFAKY